MKGKYRKSNEKTTLVLLIQIFVLCLNMEVVCIKNRYLI
jgi:hypothetical protein